MSDVALADARPFRAAVRLSPTAWAGPEAHRRYCTRHPGDAADATGPAPDPADAVGGLLGPADAAEPPPDPQAVRASPAASAAPATMILPGIGGLPSQGRGSEPPARAGVPGRLAAYCTGSPARRAGRSGGRAVTGRAPQSAT